MTAMPESIRIRNYIDGQWIDEPGVKTIPLFNPSDGKQIGEVPLSTEAASRKAHRILPHGLRGMASAAHCSTREISLRLAPGHGGTSRGSGVRDRHRPGQAHQRGPRRGAAGHRNHRDRLRPPHADPGRDSREHRRQHRRPGGAPAPGCLLRSGSVQLPGAGLRLVHPLAIGAGNTFVFKPSPQSPYFMQKMCEIFTQVGLPPGVVNVVNGDHVPTAAWYDDPRVRGICMVGSSPTARKIAEAAGRAGKRTMLLGGAKNYLVAMEDLQWDVFMRTTSTPAMGPPASDAWPARSWPPCPDIHDELIERIIAASRKIKIGSALDPTVHFGPVISAEAKVKIEGLIEIGVRKDKARLVLDGRNPEVPAEIQGGYYVGPTIFTETTPEMTIVQTEIFGPVVAVMKVENLDPRAQAHPRPGGRQRGLRLHQNLYYTEKFIAEADVGMVGVNVGVPAPHPYLPFGGIKQSLVGTDKAQGKDGIDFFTQNKIVTVRFAPPAAGRHTAEGAKDAVAPKTSAVKSCTAG